MPFMAPNTASLVERLRRVAALAPKGALWFLSVGVVGLSVDMMVFSALHDGAGLGKEAARAISLPVATVVTWTLNRRLTFGASGRKRRHEVGRYALVTVCAQGISYVTFLGVCALLPHLPPQFALLCGAAFATLFSYTGQRFFTFAPARNA